MSEKLNQHQGAKSTQADKFLTFDLDDTQFGIEILRVVEILKMMEITSVPMWPQWAKGTINLRGRVIPVVDLRQKFGLSATEETERTCTIVLELENDQIGIIVEAVNEVLEIAGDNISPAPSIGGTVDSAFIKGMGKVGEATVILLNLDKVLVEMEALGLELSVGTSAETQEPVPV